MMSINYKYNKSINNTYIKPQVGNLFFDFLSMTLDIPVNEHKKVCSAFNAYCQNWGIKPHPTRLYKQHVKLTSGKGHLIIQIDPWDESHNFLRAEFIPSKVEIFEVVNSLNLILPNGYSKLINKGPITRVDLAFDISFVHVNDLFAYYPKFQYSKNILKSGKIQTAYLGEDSCPKILAIYDKNAQMKESNKAYNGIQEVIPPYPVTRVELRLKKTGLNMSTLQSLENPFKSLEMVTAPESIGEPLWNAFIKLCRYEGLNAALNVFPDKGQKKAYRERFMSEGDGSWWNPSKPWSELPQALLKLGYPV